MKRFYLNLNQYYKTAFVTGIITLGLFLITLFMYFIKLGEYPNGILLGGLIGLLPYVILGIINKNDNENQSLIGTMVVTVLKFFVLAAILFLVAYMYYKMDIKAFNIFATVGAYTISLFVYMIINRKEAKR